MRCRGCRPPRCRLTSDAMRGPFALLLLTSVCQKLACIFPRALILLLLRFPILRRCTALRFSLRSFLPTIVQPAVLTAGESEIASCDEPFTAVRNLAPFY